jgi:uncharacterized membrane protein YbhN (UPF0104 family)
VQRRLFTALQWIFAAAVVWYAARALRGQWNAASERLANLDVQWSWIIAATLIVVVTYAILIDTWRQVVLSSGQRLSFPDAARIWFVSNLGKYIPGKVWAIGAMTVMARQRGVAGLVAGGSSIVVQLVSIAAGIALVLAAGTRLVDEPMVAALIALAVAATLVSIPLLSPPLARVIGRLTNRPTGDVSISARTIASATFRSLVAWIAYGIAFQLFVKGVLGSSGGATLSYIAVYVSSYIIGFLALFAPGGVVVRESAMIAGMVRLGLAGEADALAVAITSRIWLTVTELLPGLFYLALGKSTPGPDHTH